MANKPGFLKRAFKTTTDGVKFYRWSRNGFRGGIAFRGPPYMPVWKAISADGREFKLYRHLLSPRQVVLETTRRAKGRWEVKSTTQAVAAVTKAVRS